MKRQLIAIVTGVAFLATAAAANAACTQGNLAGNWQVYAFGAGSQGASWARCTISINGGGAIQNTTCVTPFGAAQLKGGSATLLNGPTCTYKAQFSINGPTGGLYKVDHATLSKDKEIGNGVGTFGSNGQLVFNMTKL
jgi:hypothetical protein